MDHPDPVGVYFNVLKLGDKCTVVRGNHDNYLAEYITKYYETPERKRKRLPPYLYDTFELLQQRLTPADIQELAQGILSLPLQICVELEGVNYLMAHAMTSHPEQRRSDDYFLLGGHNDRAFLQNGIPGYVSICGHSNVGGGSIWKNTLGNVYKCDCGYGFTGSRLGCLCLETGEVYYV